jgi:hypothetical protein
MATTGLLALGLACSITAGVVVPPDPTPEALTVAPPVAQAEPEPAKGKSMLGWGIFGVAFGIFNIGYGIPLTIFQPGDAVGVGMIPVGFGVGFIALGAVGIHYSKQRRAAWRAWAEAHPQQAELARNRRAPRDGVPELVVGGVLTGVGLATTIPMALILSIEPTDAPTFAYALAIMGGSSIVCGTALVVAGGFANQRLGRARRDLDARLQLAPVPWATPHGAGLGIAGRF